MSGRDVNCPLQTSILPPLAPPRHSSAFASGASRRTMGEEDFGLLHVNITLGRGKPGHGISASTNTLETL